MHLLEGILKHVMKRFKWALGACDGNQSTLTVYDESKYCFWLNSPACAVAGGKFSFYITTLHC